MSPPLPRRAPSVSLRGYDGVDLGVHRLTSSQTLSLVALAGAGDKARVSMRGVGIVHVGDKRIGSPDPAVWLRLVALGLVEGADGQIWTTPDGDALVQEWVKAAQA
ncbi:MAG: hypothetical protein RJA36_1398 [Pseudomonadota bacterium]|jgi:hypothetical protein